MRAFTIAAALGLAGLAFLTPSKAEAHEPDYRSGRGYYGNYNGGDGPRGHDIRPHEHQTYTPFGSYSWYGTGRHDYRPHDHDYSPYGTRSFSRTPWGYTESFAPRDRGYGRR